MRLANSPLATIHLQNIDQNLDLARLRSKGKRLMPVIKANAYGHGLIRVGQQLADADALAVARVAEGVALRTVLDSTTIVVLEGFLDHEEMSLCRSHRLMPVIHSNYQLDLLDDKLAFWLKINTGMFRLGFDWQDASRLANRIVNKNCVGIMSHLANADNPQSRNNHEQLDRFLVACNQVDADLPRCFGNSGGVMYLGDALDRVGCDWYRPGIMLYGGSPNGKPDPELAPGMTLTAPVISVNELKAGDAVGYGGTYTASGPCRIAVVALGYADGFPRENSEGAPVMVKGGRRSLVGRVSMDMCTVLLEDSDSVLEGDHVEFWGKQLPIDEVATCLGTISYALMAGLGTRVQRVYEGGENEALG